MFSEEVEKHSHLKRETVFRMLRNAKEMYIPILVQPTVAQMTVVKFIRNQSRD